MAAERLRFLLDIAVLPEEDLKLNSQTFNWPARMEPIFEVSQTRLVSRREKVEQELRAHQERFEAKLEKYHSAVEMFQEKEMPRSLDDIRSVAKELAEIGVSLEECKTEAMDINNEEELLQWETTPYSQIQAVQHAKEPFDRLWNTAVSYYDKHEQWMNGEWEWGECVYKSYHVVCGYGCRFLPGSGCRAGGRGSGRDVEDYAQTHSNLCRAATAQTFSRAVQDEVE